MRARAAMLAARCTEDVNKIADAHNWYRKAVQANKELPDPYLKMAEMNVRRGILMPLLKITNVLQSCFRRTNGQKTVDIMWSC